MMNEGNKNIPLVSIVCTTYNQEKYIRDALNGFIMQKTEFPFEVIIHDDASTDNTTNIIKEYESKYPEIIKPIYQKENQFSKGIKLGAAFIYPKTKGKYIALCEGDDYWIDPLKLQKQINFMKEHPDCSMCFHNARTENTFQKEKGFIFNVHSREYTSSELFLRWTVPTASMLLKKEILDLNILSSPSILDGDIMCVLLAANKGKVYGLSETMSVYRIHESGISWDPQREFERRLKYPAHIMFIKKTFPKVSSRTISKKMFWAYRHLQRNYLERKKYKMAFLCLLKKIYYRICII